MNNLKSGLTVIITFILALGLIAMLALLPKRLAFGCGESYTFFVGDSSKDCRVVSCAASEADFTRLTLRSVCGESTTYASLDLEKFLQSVDGQIVFSERLEDSVNYYCTASLPYSVTLYGKQINLHVCVKESGVTVGTPIIFGGY